MPKGKLGTNDNMYRTTLVVQRHVTEAAKRKAAIMGISLSEVIREHLAEFAAAPVPELYLADKSDKRTAEAE